MEYFARTGPGYGIEKTKLVIRVQEKSTIQRFDLKTKTWIDDADMYQIYTGSIECEPITEKQANSIVSRLS